jgi:phosphoglycolate phosphatase-like HAD superfamily hydrolase
VHDFDTACALGVDCALVANGHHSREKLSTLGVPVLEKIENVLELLC